MNPVFGARRRAEEFNSMLEAKASSSELSVARYSDLLTVVTSLRQAPAPAARAEFVSDLRSRLMLAAEGALAPATEATVRTAPETRRSPRDRRIAAVVGGFAIVSATASMAVAAQTALPGDTLYPLKRAIENAHAGVQSGNDKGSTMLGSASGRLEEVGELTRSDDQDSAVIAETLQDFVDQANEASDLLLSDYAATGHAGSIAELRSFTAASIEALKSLETLIPDEVRASLIEASQVVRQIDQQALSACPTCSDLPLTQMPMFATKQVPRLIRDLLATGSSTVDAPGVKGVSKPGPQAHPVEVGQPAPPTKTPPVTPDADKTPVLPGDGGSGGGRDTDDPLEHITTPASTGDPLTDLIAGTGDLVDGVVKGLTTP